MPPLQWPTFTPPFTHAMKITETLTTEEYWNDIRFENKKPNLDGSWKMASGDNIYEPVEDNKWKQLNSYHSKSDGSQSSDHVNRDTSVPRILISNHYVYFGGEGPRLPDRFQPKGRFDLVKTGVGLYRRKEASLIEAFEEWFCTLGQFGCQGDPWDWLKYYESDHV